MRWYKRDPDAALTGMRGLSHDEKSAYNTILDLLYSRDGDLPDDERLLCSHLECRPQWWRRVRALLLEKGKIRIETPGKLTANRVETTLKEAANFSETQSKRAQNRWEQGKKTKENNAPPMPSGNANTTTTTTTSRNKKASTAGAVHWLPNSETPSQIAEREYYSFGKQTLGKSAGGLLSSLLRHHNYDLPAARAVLDTSASKQDPREYVCATMRTKANGNAGSATAALTRFIEQHGGEEAGRSYVPGSAGPRAPFDLDSAVRPLGHKRISQG